MNRMKNAAFSAFDVGQRNESRYRDLLGAQAGLEPGGDDRLVAADILQRVVQGLAALAECRPHDVGETLAVAHRDLIARPGHQPHHRRIHLRRGPERARWHLDQRRHLAIGLQHHREPAVDLAALAGGHPLDHFLLQHEVHVSNRLGMVERMEQDRAGQVVGQVSDQPDAGAIAPQLTRQLAEVHLQDITRDQTQIAALRLGGVRERLQQIAVELDRGERAMPREQRQGQRALAGADLDEVLARLGVDRQNDPIDDAALVQEVLPEVFLGRLVEVLVHDCSVFDALTAGAYRSAHRHRGCTGGPRRHRHGNR